MSNPFLLANSHTAFRTQDGSTWPEVIPLIERAQAGDREAYGGLVERFQVSVYAMALASVRDPLEAQELAQEVFVHAMKKLPQLRDPRSFAGWLRKITERMAIDRLTRRNHFQAKRRACPGENLPDQIPAPPAVQQPTKEELVEQFRAVEQLVLRFHPFGWKPLEVMRVYVDVGGEWREAAKVLNKDRVYVTVNVTRFKEFAAALAVPPDKKNPWDDVNDVLVAHRGMLAGVGYRATVEYMVATAERLRAPNAVSRRYLLLEVALCKLLQQCGDYRNAASRLKRLQISPRGRADILGSKDEAAASSLERRLVLPQFGTPGCADGLRDATQSLRGKDNKARFLWRLAIDSLAGGTMANVPDLLSEYRDLTGEALIPSANADLTETLMRVVRGEFDTALEYTGQYLEKQTKLWKVETGIPDPSIQGVVTGLLADCYTRVLAAREGSDDRQELVEFAVTIDQFRQAAGIGVEADGLRELLGVLNSVRPGWLETIRSVRHRKQGRQKKGNQRDIGDLLRAYRRAYAL